MAKTYIRSTSPQPNPAHDMKEMAQLVDKLIYKPTMVAGVPNIARANLF